ncbi:hypothetical protein D3C71_2172140 [compost metagenome]
MHSHGLTVEGHTAIASTTTIPRIGAGPDVARARFVIEHEAKVSDFDTLVDTGDDFATTIR